MLSEHLLWNLFFSGCERDVTTDVHFAIIAQFESPEHSSLLIMTRVSVLIPGLLHATGIEGWLEVCTPNQRWNQMSINQAPLW